MQKLPTKTKGPSVPYRFLRAFGFLVSRILWRLRFVGEENIPSRDSGAVIVAANHQTYIDPVWIAVPLKHRMLFLAWDRAFSWRILGPLIRFLGAVPVNTSSGRNPRSWRAALEALEEGRGVLIFPEGAREFADGKMLPFKPGAVRLSIESGAPILPVTVRGANGVWPQGQRWPRLGRVEIVFHPLMRFDSQVQAADRKAYVVDCEEKLRSVIASGMDTLV